MFSSGERHREMAKAKNHKEKTGLAELRARRSREYKKNSNFKTKCVQHTYVALFADSVDGYPYENKGQTDNNNTLQNRNETNERKKYTIKSSITAEPWRFLENDSCGSNFQAEETIPRAKHMRCKRRLRKNKPTERCEQENTRNQRKEERE